MSHLISGPMSAEDIVALKKALRLSTADLAAFTGADQRTVARWWARDPSHRTEPRGIALRVLNTLDQLRRNVAVENLLALSNRLKEAARQGGAAAFVTDGLFNLLTEVEKERGEARFRRAWREKHPHVLPSDIGRLGDIGFLRVPQAPPPTAEDILAALLPDGTDWARIAAAIVA